MIRWFWYWFGHRRCDSDSTWKLSLRPRWKSCSRKIENEDNVKIKIFYFWVPEWICCPFLSICEYKCQYTINQRAALLFSDPFYWIRNEEHKIHQRLHWHRHHGTNTPVMHQCSSEWYNVLLGAKGKTYCNSGNKFRFFFFLSSFSYMGEITSPIGNSPLGQGESIQICK